MKRYIKLIVLCILLTGITQLYAQQVDSAAMKKSQHRIESNLKDANRLQNKIDRKQRRIEKRQNKINRQERRRGRKMKKIRKEQKKLD